MIWVADIVDGRARRAAPCAQLRYDDEERAFSIRIAAEAREADVPLMLASFIGKGQRDVGGRWARRWVEGRIVPPSRQNLGAVLKAHGLREYDELTLLESSRARSSDDDFVLAIPSCDVLGEGERPMRLEGAADPRARELALQAAGGELAQARQKAGLSQHELAERMGVDQAFVSRMESGRSNLTLSTLADAASCLGLEVEVRLRPREA
ncbi:helix-turn-helix transcriptional regulator [Adlercreutzia sp. ZJ242]|uniref:helix-turn-helix domain-containing protein n=1 Tax=Adlercreutzia sp. ZJ242 TaxID=2709409 RepID=UPI00197CCF7F|nr:helix-turn-helix transcriptional regulator [Adlercreutzia sp. ZJ242]